MFANTGTCIKYYKDNSWMSQYPKIFYASRYLKCFTQVPTFENRLECFAQVQVIGSMMDL